MNTVTNPLISAFSFGLFVTTNLLIFQLTLRAIFLILSVGVVPQNCRTSYLLLMNKCFFLYNYALHSFLNTFVALRTQTFSFTLLPVSPWNHTNLKLQSKNMEYYAALIRSGERNTITVFLVLLYNTLQPPIFHHSFTAMSSVILFWPFSILRLVIFISSCLYVIPEAFTANSTAILVHALVPSRIDYCNTILSDLSNKIFHSLQLVHNGAVLVITRTPSVEDITPVLQ